MRYYLIAGEASGDLHASHLITALKERDKDARFRFFGGDKMLAAAQGGVGKAGESPLVRHYRDLAYMGFIPVLLHLRTIMKGMEECKKDILAWQPDCVIFVDYAGFNLKIAKWLHKFTQEGQSPLCKFPHLVYYIAPKIWAWKEWRIKNFKRDIDTMLCILPFEKEWFEKKHGYPVHYVGNPTADEVREFSPLPAPPKGSAAEAKQTIALLAGSRRQEIKDNLWAMLEATKVLPQGGAERGRYNLVIAGAPSLTKEDYYELCPSLKDYDIEIRFGETYQILSEATAALVTSGTATLETALFGVPQVVCYKTPVPWLTRWAFNHIIKCPYISLVNLIAGKEVVKELFADTFSVDNIRKELKAILPGGQKREQMLKDYKEVWEKIGPNKAPDEAAKIITEELCDH